MVFNYHLKIVTISWKIKNGPFFKFTAKIWDPQNDILEMGGICYHLLTDSWILSWNNSVRKCLQIFVTGNFDLIATSFGQGLRPPALTLIDLRSLPSNVHISRRKFFTLWPPVLNQRKFSGVHSFLKQPISQWNTGYICLKMGFLWLERTCKEICESVLSKL